MKPHRMKQLLWRIVNATLFRCFPGAKLYPVRNQILRLFGAKISHSLVIVYPSCKIWAPWNLELGSSTCIGPNTEIYNKATVKIGENCVISQGTILCTASHDISHPQLALVTEPVIIHDQVWVASNAFVGMGVTIGEGAVVGARAAVFKNVEPWTVVGGNPAKFIKKRIIKE